MEPLLFCFGSLYWCKAMRKCLFTFNCKRILKRCVILML